MQHARMGMTPKLIGSKRKNVGSFEMTGNPFGTPPFRTTNDSLSNAAGQHREPFVAVDTLLAAITLPPAGTLLPLVQESRQV